MNMYHGREHSYIKHLFLTRYLECAAYKTLQGRSPIFNFVDAFAGPWKISDDANFSDASFDQALRTLDTVRITLGRSGVSGIKIRFVFCERRTDAINALKHYAQENRKFEIHVFEGSFEDHLDSIAGVCRDGFTFTFIDPTGWNIRAKEVFHFLRARKGEFLLNFMAEHVNRHAGYSKVTASFGRFLADPGWEDAFRSLPTDWNNEKRVLHLLKERLKSSRTATYLPELSIMNPRQERVKMRLLLGTHSSKGVEVFRDAQAKVERTEIELRNGLRNSGSKQICLISDEEVAAIQQNVAGIGCPKFEREAEALIQELLTGHSFRTFASLATDVLEAVPIRMPQVRRLMKRLKQIGVIKFDLPPRKRLAQPETCVYLCRKTVDTTA